MPAKQGRTVVSDSQSVAVVLIGTMAIGSEKICKFIVTTGRLQNDKSTALYTLHKSTSRTDDNLKTVIC